MNSWLAVNIKIYERIVRGCLYERAERMFKGRLIQMQENIFSHLTPVMQVVSISFIFWLNESDICLLSQYMDLKWHFLSRCTSAVEEKNMKQPVWLEFPVTSPNCKHFYLEWRCTEEFITENCWMHVNSQYTDRGKEASVFCHLGESTL